LLLLFFVVVVQSDMNFATKRSKVVLGLFELDRGLMPVVAPAFHSCGLVLVGSGDDAAGQRVGRW
jgi:hypothetical protein